MKLLAVSDCNAFGIFFEIIQSKVAVFNHAYLIALMHVHIFFQREASLLRSFNLHEYRPLCCPRPGLTPVPHPLPVPL